MVFDPGDPKSINRVEMLVKHIENLYHLNITNPPIEYINGMLFGLQFANYLTKDETEELERANYKLLRRCKNNNKIYSHGKDKKRDR
jgi:hypothetical protein